MSCFFGGCFLGDWIKFLAVELDIDSNSSVNFLWIADCVPSFDGNFPLISASVLYFFPSYLPALRSILNLECIFKNVILLLYVIVIVLSYVFLWFLGINKG